MILAAAKTHSGRRHGVSFSGTLGGSGESVGPVGVVTVVTCVRVDVLVIVSIEVIGALPGLP